MDQSGGSRPGRHLQDVLPGALNSKPARDAIRAAAEAALENPIATFDHVLTGGVAAKGFLSQVNGRLVAFFVSKVSKGKVRPGDLVTAFPPSAQQLAKYGYGKAAVQ